MPAGFSNPFYGDRAIYSSGDNLRGWLTGGVALEDLQGQMEAQQNPNLLSGSQVRGMQTWSPWEQQRGAREGLYGQATTNALAAQNRGAAQMDLAAQGQIAAQQQDLASMLRSRATGGAPSLAEMMLGRERENNIAASRSAAASMQGLTPAMRARLAQSGMEQANISATQQGAMLRAQEQAQAEQALAAQLGSMRGSELGIAQANLGAQMQQRQANDAMSAQAQAVAAERARQEQAAAAEEARYKQQLLALQAQAQEGQLARNQQSQGGMLSAAGSVLGAIFSDKTVKKNITSGEKEIGEFLDALGSAYTYRYKKSHDDGGKRHLGVMAQDLEKSQAGKRMVVNVGGKKAIAPDAGTVLAALGAIHKRLQSVGA
jgi:hypothetical protein